MGLPSGQAVVIPNSVSGPGDETTETGAGATSRPQIRSYEGANTWELLVSSAGIILFFSVLAGIATNWTVGALAFASLGAVLLVVVVPMLMHGAQDAVDVDLVQRRGLARRARFLLADQEEMFGPDDVREVGLKEYAGASGSEYCPFVQLHSDHCYEIGAFGSRREEPTRVAKEFLQVLGLEGALVLTFGETRNQPKQAGRRMWR